VRYSTTNIRIETDILKELKLKAVHEGKRVAELIRDAINKYLGKKSEKLKVKEIENDPLFKIIGMFESGDKNASENIDEVVYGKKR